MATRPTQHFVKGQAIILEGSEGDRTYKILSGEVLICKRNSAKDLVPIARLGPGEIFGEMYLFEGGRTRSATAVAATSEVSVEIYFQTEMLEMLRNTPATVNSMIQGFNHRLKTTSQQFAETYQDKRVAHLPDGTMKPTGTGMEQSS